MWWDYCVNGNWSGGMLELSVVEVLFLADADAILQLQRAVSSVPGQPERAYFPW